MRKRRAAVSFARTVVLAEKRRQVGSGRVGSPYPSHQSGYRAARQDAAESFRPRRTERGVERSAWSPARSSTRCPPRPRRVAKQGRPARSRYLVIGKVSFGNDRSENGASLDGQDQ